MANHQHGGAPAPAQPESLHFDVKFENPYNFVPAPPRDTTHPTLGDAEPAGHHRYQEKLWSGRISVQLTTVTPLLIPDQPRIAANGHQTFAIRTDEKDAPSLPPTTIKGVLRTAYEAVTNSRLGVWSKRHDTQLAFRQPADSALGLIPVRVVRTVRDGRTILAAAEHQAEALRFYSMRSTDKGRGAGTCAKRYGNITKGDTMPQHGDCLQINMASGELAWVDETESVAPGWRRGYAVINGPNIKEKTQERIFLEMNRPRTIPITRTVAQNWQALISDYQELHVGEIAARKLNRHCAHDFLGHKPGETAWSRHVWDSESSKLKHGLLCYARVTDDGRLTALYPVLISRDRFSLAPSDLLDASLRPATSLSQLSPADRVFGWAHKNGQYKGQLRVARVRCAQGKEGVEAVGDEGGIPLAILASPKPAQARFYAARNKQGTPYDRGTDKADMYRDGDGLRGRKFYPHQPQSAMVGYWDSGGAQPAAPLPKLDQHTIYPEWRHAGNNEDSRSDQNRSIAAWVKPGSTFNFDLEVANISSVELGALLWLLTLGKESYLRMGGGKPLGFGSVRLAITGVDLCDGEAMRTAYATFGAPHDSGQRLTFPNDLAPLIAEYQQALQSALGTPRESFDNLCIIKAFRNAARGGRLPVHYPRTQRAPSAQGENFKWFVANEAKTKRRQERYSLPDLAQAEHWLWVLKDA